MCGKAGRRGKARGEVDFLTGWRYNLASVLLIFKKWGCTGIRQDDPGLSCCNQGVALSPLISVQRKIDAKTSMSELVAKFKAAQGMGNLAFAPVAVAA